MKQKCDHCQAKFERTTTWQKFCSPLCRLRANRKAKRIRQAAEQHDGKPG